MPVDPREGPFDENLIDKARAEDADGTEIWKAHFCSAPEIFRCLSPRSLSAFFSN